MKKLLSLTLIVFVCMSFAVATDTEPVNKDGLFWYTDINKAQTASTKSKKPIFAFFTGSDWCGWCHKLQRNVFAKQAFKDWAKANVVLLELDFPRFKQLPKELAEQNAGLQQAFQVQGFPTIWIFNLQKDSASQRFTILPFGQLGYPSGAEAGKEEVAFIATANSYLKKSN